MNAYMRLLLRLLLQPVSDDFIRTGRSKESTAVRSDDNVLLAVAPRIGRGHALTGSRQFVAPQFFSVTCIEGAEVAVDRRTDEHQIARSRNRAAGIRCACRFDT